jgi:hypothetical protein
VTREMDRDLEAFARGEVSRQELMAAHGPEAVALADLHERMHATLGTSFDEDAGWSRVVEGMETAATVTTIRRSRRPRSVVALAVAAALTIGGSALAAVEVEVRRHAGSEASTVPAHTEGPGVASEPLAAPVPDGDQAGTATETTSTDGTGRGASIDNGGGGSGADANPAADSAVPGENATSSGESDDHGTSSGGSGSEHGSSGDGDDEGSSGGGNDQGSGDGSGGNDQGTSGNDDDHGNSGGSGSGGDDNDQGSGDGSHDQGPSQGDNQN